MSTVIGRLISAVFSTTGVTIALATGAAWLFVRPRECGPRRFLVTAALAYLVASTYAFPIFVGRAFTAGYRPLVADDVPAGSRVVIVLGAGIASMTGWNDDSLSVLEPASAGRVLEGHRLYKLIAPDLIIVSGGTADPGTSLEPSAITMRRALVDLGVPASAIEIESTSRSTRDQAVLVTRLLRAHSFKHIVLVTSSLHMRRSMAAFRAVGWTPIPAIAPDRVGLDRWWRWIVPTAEALNYTGSLVHEGIGLPYYGVRGWLNQ